eukprot:Sspe_Gene.110587::Locus_91645_Transcript_1_1_Confidence_1.000_Length_464::g.110587::m.110587
MYFAIRPIQAESLSLTNPNKAVLKLSFKGKGLRPQRTSSAPVKGGTALWPVQWIFFSGEEARVKVDVYDISTQRPEFLGRVTLCPRDITTTKVSKLPLTPRDRPGDRVDTSETLGYLVLETKFTPTLPSGVTVPSPKAPSLASSVRKALNKPSE